MKNTVKEQNTFSVSDQASMPLAICQNAELIFILEGSMELTVSDACFELQPDDVIILNINDEYHYHASQNILYAKLTLADNLLNGIYNGINASFQCNSALASDENYARIRVLLKRMLLNQTMLEESDANYYLNFEYLSQYYQLLELLSTHFLRKISDASSGTAAKMKNRMLEISAYIHKNYAQKINLKDLSDNLYLSEGYLSRFFTQNFGMSFSKYIMQIRFQHATEDLLYSDKSITDIAYDNGFSSLAFFNRAFKSEYGKTPSAVRAEAAGGSARQSSSPSDKDRNIQKRLSHIFYDEEIASVQREQDILRTQSYSVRESQEFQPFWNTVINIGSTSDLLRTGVQEHLLMLRNALRFQYARFWDLFSEDMLIDANNHRKTYNFAKLDNVFDYILSIGMKPFIDLEKKPKRISKNVTSTLYYDDTPVIFNSLENWNSLIRAFIRHFIKRYGIEEVSTWKIEIYWNGYQIRDMSDEEASYLIFVNTYQILKEYAPLLEIGGPGGIPSVSLPSYKALITSVARMENAGIPSDFFSCLDFAYETDSTNRAFARKSMDPEYLLHSSLQLRRTLGEWGITPPKLYISEWNRTVSDRNPVNDSCFQGAYIIKNVIDMFGKTDLLGYFNGTDLISQHYDSNELLHGGNGLISKNGIFKPSGFAIDFLNHLYPYFIGKGQNYIITTDRKDNYSIVFHNMKNLSYYYYTTSDEKIERDKLVNCFEDDFPLEVNLDLRDVADGDYLIRIQRINNRNGNILSLWKDFNYYPELSRDDIRYFRRVCEPKLTIHPYQVKNSKLSIKLSLEANEFALAAIEKLL